MRRLLKEPLLHFFLLGTAIFAAYGLVSERTGSAPGTIVITRGQVASMVEGFTRTWQRPPTRAELQGLVRDRVRDEVYSREAIALGLDKDDTVIRRRLRQKMEFVSDDTAAQIEPTDADLNAYLQAHPEAFRVEPRFTFSQVYLDPEGHGDHLARDTAQLLAQLNRAGGQTDASTLGDSLLLEHSFTAVLRGAIATQFGEGFAARLGELAPGHWHGPVESGYGVHLVFISERTAGRLPALPEVRDAVRREWVNARRLQANEQVYQRLLERYDVTVELSQPVGPALAAEGR